MGTDAPVKNEQIRRSEAVIKRDAEGKEVGWPCSFGEEAASGVAHLRGFQEMAEIWRVG